MVLFGWNTRCGVELPLTFALAYAVARFAGARTNHMIGLSTIVVVQVLVLARDASITTILSAIPVAVPAAALCYGIGLFVQSRVTKKQSGAVAPVIERVAV